MLVNGINLITVVSHIQPFLPDKVDLLWKTGGEFGWWEALLGPGYLTGRGLWCNLCLRESIKVTPSNMGPSTRYGEGMLGWQVLFKVRCVPTWSWEGHDSAPAPPRLLSCSTVGVSSRPVDQCLFLSKLILCMLTHLTGKQCVGVEHAMLQEVGYHMPENTQFYINFRWLWWMVWRITG